MNTVQQLEKFINDPSSTKYDQLLKFIEYAGQTQTAPTISLQDQKYTASFTTDNNDYSEQVIIQNHKQQNFAISCEKITTNLDIVQTKNSEQLGMCQKINDAFDFLQLNYLHYQKKQYGIVKRVYHEGLQQINDAFFKLQ